MRHAISLTLILGLLASACADDDPSVAVPDAGDSSREVEPQASATDGCKRDQLEPDMQRMPFAGPGVRDGAIQPGEYLMATTYLRLRGEQAELFQRLVGPIIADISARPGLVALTTARSDECGTARTLTVWRDEAAMLEFVVGEAHAKAMQSIHELSRGGSVAAQWMGDQSTASWDDAAKQLATTDRMPY